MAKGNYAIEDITHDFGPIVGRQMRLPIVNILQLGRARYNQDVIDTCASEIEELGEGDY